MSSEKQTASIVVLMGLPAAGKTTFSKLLSDKIDSKTDLKSVRVTYDELIPLEIQKKYAQNPSETEWKTQRQTILNSVDKLLEGQEAQDL